MLCKLCIRRRAVPCVCVFVCVYYDFSFSTHQQHEVVEPLAGLVELHRADPRSLEGLVVGRQ